MTASVTRSLPAYREFTREQSSAISSLHVEREGYVEVVFHNGTRAYGFDSNPTFCEDLIEAMSYSDLPISLGRMIAQARKNGNMTAIEYPED